jgi:O-antigen ligase
VNWVRRNLAEVLAVLAIVACVGEGAVRKWVFRDAGGFGQYGPYFAKDVIFGLLIMFCRPKGPTDSDGIFRRVLSVGLPVTIAGAALSTASGFSAVGALLSLRSLVVLPLLCYFAVPRLRAAKLGHVMLVIAVLLFGNALLGMVQYSSPADGVVNFYANENVSNAVAFEENVRAVGTFSYITGYANFATVGAWAGLVLVSLARGRLMYVATGWATFVAGLMAAMASISRGTVLIVLGLLLTWVMWGNRSAASWLKGAAGVTAILVLGFAFNLTPLFMRLGNTVWERHEASEESVEERVTDPIEQVLPAADLTFTGRGFGLEQVGGVFADYGVMSFRTFEYQFPRLVLETGVIGLLGFLITSTGPIYAMFARGRQIADPDIKRILATTIFLLGSFFYINVVFNHIASFFAWIIAALVLAYTDRYSLEAQ